MSVLRMLAFRPAGAGGEAGPAPSSGGRSEPARSASANAAAQAAAAMREMGGGRQAAPSAEASKPLASEAPVQETKPRPQPEPVAAPVAKAEPMPIAAAASEPAPRAQPVGAAKPQAEAEPRPPLTWPDEELSPKPNHQRVSEPTEAPARATAPVVERAAAPERIELRPEAPVAMPTPAAAEPMREMAPPTVSVDPGPSLFGSPGPDSEASVVAPRVETVSAPAAPARPSEPITMPARAASASAGGIADDDAWHALVDASGLRGPARILAEHASFVAYGDGVLTLSLPADDDHLRAPALIKMVADALASRLGAAPQIRFEAASAAGESLHARNLRARDERQASAEERFMNDPDVRRLIDVHGAKVVPDSIRPYDEA
jgi:DNA polymerase-3 subunit gamma/tau